MNKVSIIGAGNVGATAAMKIAELGIFDKVVLLDIKEGVAEGKAMDIMQSLMMKWNNNTVVIGTTNDYTKTAKSDIIVITSGMPRKPGMTREELVGVNSKIMASVLDHATKYSPDATFVVVSNPMDTMTQMVRDYLIKNYGTMWNFDHRVIGLGGSLDSARFKYTIWAKLNEKMPDAGFVPDDVQNAYVLGGHGDKTMIPVVSEVTVYGNPLTNYLNTEEIEDVVDRTMRGGAILTGLLGTSAWEAPAQAIADMCTSICEGNDEMFTASVWREEYGCCIGSLIQLTEDAYGAPKVYIANDFEEPVKEKLLESVEAVKKVNEALKSE